MTTGRQTLELLAHDGTAKDVHRVLSELLAQCDYARPAAAHEAVGVTSTMPKTAALCFDRVWAGFDRAVPSDIAFWGGSRCEISFFHYIARIMTNVIQAGQTLPQASVTAIQGSNDVVESMCRTLADGIRSELHRKVTPLYESNASRDAEYVPGETAAVVAMLRNVPIVSEGDLTWEQVLEFRRDADSVKKFRRLIHWLDADMAGKSLAFVEDEIFFRVENYEASLAKFGMKAMIGSLASTLDSKVLLGGPAAVAALSYAKQPFWAVLAGTSVVVGKVAVHIGQQLLAYKELKEQCEVALVSELRKSTAA